MEQLTLQQVVEQIVLQSDLYTSMSIAAWLCVTASLWFAMRHPAANAFLGITLVGMGGTPLFGDIRYARVIMLVGVVTIVRLLLLPPRDEMLPRLKLKLSPPLALLIITCFVITGKILLESTVMLQMDEVRKRTLIAAVTESCFPLSLLGLSLVKNGVERTAHDILLGLMALSALMAIGFTVSPLGWDWFLESVEGLRRWSFAGGDPINSGRVLAYGAAACATSFQEGMINRKTLIWKLAIFGLLMTLLVLTGNRQFTVMICVFITLWAFSSGGPWFLRLFVLGSIITVFGALFSLSDTGLSLLQRLSPSELLLESEIGRGWIWHDVFEQLAAHPLTGTGFRNGYVGDEFLAGYDLSGEPVILRDSAHGAFQDVLLEHGLILGIAFFVGAIWLIGFSFKSLIRATTATWEVAFKRFLLGAVVALPFSGNFLNSVPLFMLMALASIGIDVKGKPPVVSGETASSPI